MALGANNLESRMVRQYVPDGRGGYFMRERIQFRTKNVTSSVLGLIPLSSSWSAWAFLDDSTLVNVDENGDPITVDSNGWPV